jgi:hypothetical protein
MTTLSIAWNYAHGRDYLCQCDNCMERMRSGCLTPISDAEQRLTPGEETPAGQCPNCWGLVYVIDEARRR